MSKVVVEGVYLKDRYGMPKDLVYFRRKEDGLLDWVQLVAKQRDELGVYAAFLEWCKDIGYEVVTDG